MKQVNYETFTRLMDEYSDSNEVCWSNPEGSQITNYTSGMYRIGWSLEHPETGIGCYYVFDRIFERR